ncbi:serine/threonine-protein kinase [Marinitenerispora sediminis]|uniref:serine/threonine-protein kinase n=1 Tax=Marinitenerispora sediminis TaxID=1931232 RepID=UPI0015F164AE|nr:serine/threonine-protein kinase [Marinitenerispora sediminis]
MTDTGTPRLAPLTADDPEQVGAFQIIGRLGAGGMGLVYFGRDASGYPAAVKTVRAEYAADPGYRARFEREVQLAQRVRGRCVAPLLAADPRAEQPWLAVAYVPGPTLRGYLEQHGPLTGTDLSTFAAGLAEALTAIHREGIVHRDLKPDNVILAPDGPKVLDFGIAQALDEASMTRTDIVVGTPGWISPERYDGHRAGPASDMFCWGGLVAYAASGRQPFGTGPMEVLRYRVLNEAPDTARAELPPALHEVVARSLSRAPEDRPDAPGVFTAITGAAVPAGDGGEGLTRVATRLLDSGWTVAIPDDSAGFPDSPLRATSVRPPITFAGHSVREPAELARLFGEHHDRAERWLCDDGAARLHTWLDEIGDGDYDRDYLARIDGPERAAAAVTAFVAAYLPDSLPRYRGHDVSADGLRRLAARGPAEHQVLSAVVLGEIPLIAAGHRCGHPGCGERCARLERIGHQARETIDGALLIAAGMGFRLAPAERDRAVAIGIETVDEPGRRVAVRTALSGWPSVAVPWWRALAGDALAGDPASAEGRARIAALRLLTPFARKVAPLAWRGLLRPRAWLSPGLPRAAVLTFLLCCLTGFTLSGLMSNGLPEHPLPEADGYARALAFQMELWPVYLPMAVCVAAMPRRFRAGAVLYTLLLTLLASAVIGVLPRAPMLVPAFIRDPLVGGLAGIDDFGALIVFLAFTGAVTCLVSLLVWAAAAGPPAPLPAPLLARRGPLARAAAGIPAVGVAIWLPLWAVTMLLAVVTLENEPQTSPGEFQEVFAVLTTVALPAALALGALSYLLWRWTGAHAVYLSVIALVLLMSGLVDSGFAAPIPGAGVLSYGLLDTYGTGFGWVVLLILLPGVFVLAAWLSERLRYRRPRPRPRGGHPPYQPPVPPYHPSGYGTPTPPPGAAGYPQAGWTGSNPSWPTQPPGPPPHRH